MLSKRIEIDNSGASADIAVFNLKSIGCKLIANINHFAALCYLPNGVLIGIVEGLYSVCSYTPNKNREPAFF